MGELVDFRKAREKRQAKADRSVSKAYVPQETPIVDQDWDEDAERHVHGASHGDRDPGDET